MENRIDKLDDLIEQFLATITEYADVVQISVSFTEDVTGDTVGHHKGTGNWYARQGLARDFIEQEKARTKIKVEEDES